MDKILELLKDNARLNNDQIAATLNMSAEEVGARIHEYEEKGVILKYKAVIDTGLLEPEGTEVNALIEVSVSPQKDVGFDHVAERIYRFPEVTHCYLLSGEYDLLVIIHGRNIHEVASFISEKLAPMDFVRSTVTHFMLKCYKQDGHILKKADVAKRLNISY